MSRIKTHVKSGDEVVVIAGNEKGKRAKVVQVLPQDNRVIVEGVNLRKHHERKTRENPEGSITERESPLHLSNVMRADRYDARRK